MIKQLESSTVRKINSGQVITNMKSVVKELVENSLDAGADYIDIRLEDSGFGSITVADNGSGISRKDRSLCALGHHTSKIVDLSSLESLASYGFRGEALHSICECATSVQITTMTSSEKSATTVTYSHTGAPDSTKPAPAISAVPLTAHTHGTTIVASGLWGSHPVRKEYLRSLTKTEARKIQEMMLSYALIRPDVRFVLKNPPAKIFVSGPCPDVGQSVLTNYGPLLFETLQKVEFSTETVKIEGFLPSKNAEKSIALRKTNDRCFLYINSRPVDFPKVSKMVNSSVRKWFEVEDSKSYPFTLLNFVLDPNLYDINLTPDKRKVLFTNDDDVLKAVSDMLIELYPVRSVEEKETDDEGDDIFKSPKRQKRDKSDNDDNNGSLYSTQLTDFFKKQRPKAPQEETVTEEGSLDNEDIVFDTTSTQRQLTKRKRSSASIDEDECDNEDTDGLPPKKRSPSEEKKKSGRRDFERLGAVSEDIPVSINPDIISQAQLSITSSSPRNSVIRIKHNPITFDNDRYWVPRSADNAEIVGITKIGSLQKAFWAFLVFQDPSKPQPFQRVPQNRSHSFGPSSSSSSSSSLSTSSGSSQSSASSSVDSSPSKSSVVVGEGSGISMVPKMFMLSWERAEEVCHVVRQLRRAVYPSDPVLGDPLRVREEDISDSVAWRLLYQHSKRTTDALGLNSFKVVSDDGESGDGTPCVKVVEVPRGIEYKDVAGEIRDVLKQLLRGTRLPICKYVGKALLERAPMKGLSGPPTPEAGMALLREVVSSRISSCPHGKRLFQLLANYQIK